MLDVSRMQRRFYRISLFHKVSLLNTTLQKLRVKLNAHSTLLVAACLTVAHLDTANKGCVQKTHTCALNSVCLSCGISATAWCF